MNTLELLRQLVRQQTVGIGEPVTNLHGGVAPEASSVVVSRDAEWAVLQLAGASMRSLNEFYSTWYAQTSRTITTIQAVDGVILIGEPDSNKQGAQRAYLVRGCVRAESPVVAHLEVEALQGLGSFAVYVDGVLQRRGSNRLTMPLALDTGQHVIDIMAVAELWAVSLPSSIRVQPSNELLDPPIWSSIIGGYMDIEGTPIVTLTWHTDPRVGGWVLRRRDLQDLGTIMTVSEANTVGEFGVEIDGDWTRLAIAGQDLLAGHDLMGTILQSTYTTDTTRTLVRLRLSNGRIATSPFWTSRNAATGQFVELTRIRRADTTPLITYVDTHVVVGQGYEYGLQPFGFFGETTLGPLSTIEYVRAGDAPIPQIPRTTAVFDDRSPDGAVSMSIVRATFRMTPTPDTQDSGTSTGANAATTLNDTGKLWTPNQFSPNDATRAVFYVRIDGTAAAAGQMRRVEGNTTTQITVTPPWTTIPGTDPYVLLKGGTVYRVGPTGGFTGVWAPSFITRSPSGDIVEYYSELYGVPQEAIQRALIDADVIPSIGILTMVENTANVLSIDIADVDDDAKTWELYIKKGSWPTLNGLFDGAVDPVYRRFEGPISVRSLSTSGGNATWYAVAMPYNSYGDPGVRATASAVVDGVGANQGALSNLAVTPNDDGSIASYNKLYWDHNSVLDSPDTNWSNWFARYHVYRGDQGPGTEIEFGHRDNGTSTGSNTSTTLNDTTKAWTVNAYTNFWVYVSGGLGSGQYRKVSSNTATQLTVASAWTTTPNGTSTYIVLSRYPRLDVGGNFLNNDDTDTVASKGSILHGTPEKRATPSTGVYRTWYYTVELFDQGTLKTSYTVNHSDYYDRTPTQFATASIASVSLHTGGACAGPDSKGFFYGDPSITMRADWDIQAGTENDVDYELQLLRSGVQTVVKSIVSSTNASPISVQVTGHGYTTGQQVTIEEHLTNTPANGTWTITVSDSNNFTLNGSTGLGVGGATGKVVRNSDFYLVWVLSTSTEAKLDSPSSKVLGELYQPQTIYTTYQVRIIKKAGSIIVDRKTTNTRSDAVGRCSLP